MALLPISDRCTPASEHWLYNMYRTPIAYSPTKPMRTYSLIRSRNYWYYISNFTIAYGPILKNRIPLTVLRYIASPQPFQQWESYICGFSMDPGLGLLKACVYGTAAEDKASTGHTVWSSLTYPLEAIPPGDVIQVRTRNNYERPI